MRSKSKKNYQRGLLGEAIAKTFLWLKGYTILEKRYRNSFGEIDLIVRKKYTLIAVEIKFRKTRKQAAESINAYQKGRINRTFSAYCTKLNWAPEEYRFDVVFITPYSLPFHMKNAWQIEN